MGFVIGVVVALIVVFLLAYITVKKPVFGEVIIAVSVLMILASVFFYFQKDNRAENKKNLIPVEQIELSDISHSLAYGNYYKLTAHLKNLSQQYRLQAITLKLSFFQCPELFEKANDKDFKSCRLITEKQHKIDTRLAAQQGADIESYILLDDDSFFMDINSLYWQIKLIDGIAR